MQKDSTKLKKLITWAMITAIAYVVMYLSKLLPQVYTFLQFDMKDTVICLGGFVFGPLASAAISLVVTFLEMISASDTGPIGFLMNLISTCTFCCTAAFVYHRAKGSKKGVVMGLVLATLALTVVMLLWNYLITPIYQGIPRSVVAGMLPTVFLPFNLVKGGLNMAAVLVLYQPVLLALRRAGLAPEQPETDTRGSRIGFACFALAVLATFVLIALVLWGVL